MDRLGAWLWRRHRERFAPSIVATVTVMLIPWMGVAIFLVASIYLGLSATETSVWVASTVVCLIVAVALGMWSLREFLAPLRSWIAGDASDPSAAWLTVLRFPQALAQRGFLVLLPLALATSLPIAVALAEPDAIGTVALALAHPLVVGAGALFLATSAQLLVRPAADEIAAGAPAVGHIDPGAWSVRLRLVAVVFTTSAGGGLTVSALVVGDAATSGDYLLAMVASICFGGYWAAMTDAVLVKPILRPLRDVMAGTSRVRRGDATTSVPVTTLDELGDLATAFNAMQRGLREREALQAAFGSYVDPLLAQRLVDSGSSVFEGEEVEVTVLFADVRSFTSYSETVAPAEAVALLNRLFDVIVPVLHEHGGHANHYLGDGLLAIFGAPGPLEHHADAAVAAAVAIQRHVREAFGDELRLGIGINTGSVIAGTVGGGGRHEFTVIGDTVNVAARVEQLTKESGDAILVTEATLDACSTPPPRTTERGAFDVRGRTNRVTLHCVNPFPRTTARSG